MKILVFSWRDPKHPLAGGAEQVMHEHMKGWIEASHSVDLFSSRFKDSLETENLDGIKIVRQGNQYLGVQLRGFLHYLKNKDNYDLVVDQFHGLPFFTPLYVSKPILAVIQESAKEVWFLNPLPKPLNWIIGLIGYFGEPLLFFFYKNTPFMTGSASAKEEVGKLGIPKDQITIVPHGVIINKPKPMPKKEKIKTIVYLGILTKDKGIEDALRTFSFLNKKGKFQFWVIGKAETKDYFNRLKKITEKLKLRDKVKFWGFIDQEKKFSLLARAHLMINPSVREGWGLVNIEANAMGTPVVAYQSPGLIDSIRDGETGILSKQNTPKELAKEILSLLKDKKRYQQLQKGALSWSKGFSWEDSKEQSLKLIEAISSKKGA